MKDEGLLKKYGLDNKSICEFRSRIETPTAFDRNVFTDKLKGEILSQNCDMKVVEELILKGADVNCFVYGSLPVKLLIEVAGLGKWELVFLLLKSGADINAKRQDGSNVLFYTLYDRYIEYCKVLIAFGVDVNCSNYELITPLVRAVYNNSPEVVELLLESGVKTNFQNILGESLIEISHKYNHTRVEKILRDYCEKQKNAVVTEMFRGENADKEKRLEAATLKLAQVLKRK